jgi:hypothetical protein
MTFHVFFMSSMPTPAGWAVVLDVARHQVDRLLVISPEVSQLGMPAGEP